MPGVGLRTYVLSASGLSRGGRRAKIVAMGLPANRTASALALAVIGLMTAQLFWRLGEFPGLHGDEAWVGLFALRLKERGLFTPHEMNTYTGALYGWLLSGVFDRFGVGVWSLRLIGAVANPLAWLVVWATVRRAAGPGAGLAWALLAAVSGIVVLKSRVAWEVYALQPLFASLALAAAARLAESGGRPWALLLFAASLLGVQNHFIFLSLPLALLLAAVLLSARRPDGGVAAFLPAGSVNVALCLVLFLVKPWVTEAAWETLRVPLLAAFWSAPLAGIALLVAAERRLGTAFAALASPNWTAAAPWLKRGFVGLLAVCAWFHALAFVEIQSGVSVAQRLASVPVPWVLALPLYAWGAAVVWTAFSDSWRRLSDGGEGLAPGAALLCALPVAYAAVFILFRNTSSIRYYVIPCHLALAALAVSWPRRPELHRPRTLGLALAGSLGAAGLLATAASGPSDRAPFRFKVGWRKEKSHDFLNKDGLYAFMDRERLCSVVEEESMIDIPLIFMRRANPPASCDPSRAVRTRYCADCSREPYIVAEVVSIR